jgi:hypothetical protein
LSRQQFEHPMVLGLVDVNMPAPSAATPSEP